MSNKIIKIVIFALGVAITSFYSCSEKKAAGTGLLDPNGLSRDINDIVPDSVLQKVKDLGMPVNTGDTCSLQTRIDSYFTKHGICFSLESLLKSCNHYRVTQ